MRPVILLTNPVHDEVRARLQAVGDVVMNAAGEPWRAEEVADRVREATALMGFMTDRVDAALLKNAPRLRIVAAALKGYDSYDAAACARAGVWLSIVPDLLTESTAELAVGLAIGLGRHVRAGDRYVREADYRGWRAHFYGTGLKDAVVAVVGLGHVGRAIVERLAGFGCARLLGVDPGAGLPGVEAVGLDAALAEADFLLLAAPLTPATRHLLDAGRLQRCKQGQLIVNVGRGSVVDERALADALAAGRVGGYAADVFACEDRGLPDPPAGIPPALLAHPATLFTPHLGSAVRRVRLAIEHRAADNIIAVLEGRVPPDAIAGPPAAMAEAYS
ncbi:MAG: NAD(P)-dependent oxidoreductase [Pseudomonadota bacterium]